MCTPLRQLATTTWGELLFEKGLVARLDQVRQSVSEKASVLVFTAIGFLGVPYRRGGNTVETGFDCSGFVKAMYEQRSARHLPRKADQQAAATEKIYRSDLQPGDLVFFNTMRRAFSHVGIYIGEGKFVHSPKPGSEVRVDDTAASTGAGASTAPAGCPALPRCPTAIRPISPP